MTSRTTLRKYSGYGNSSPGVSRAVSSAPFPPVVPPPAFGGGVSVFGGVAVFGCVTVFGLVFGASFVSGVDFGIGAAFGGGGAISGGRTTPVARGPAGAATSCTLYKGGVGASRPGAARSTSPAITTAWNT